MLLPTFDELKRSEPTAPVVVPPKRTFSVIESVPVARCVRVAGYARVSTEGEDQKSSIEIQHQHFLSQVAAHSDWTFAGIYCDIISGTKKETREMLQKLLKDCRSGKIDLVLTKSISRFARNTADLLEMVRDLASLGVGIIFERENIDTRTMGSEFLLTILASLAEDESHSISSNCRWGIQKRFKDGTYRISTAPYGYDLVDGQLIVNKAEAAIVREIFEKYLSGQSLNDIAENLNQRGIPTKRIGEIQKGKITVEGKWRKSTVAQTLDNLIYTGNILLQKTYRDQNFVIRKNEGQYPFFYAEEHHEPIIDFDNYEAAKALREKRKVHSKCKGKVKYTFTSLLKCGYCGANLEHYNSNQGVEYWICREHRKKAMNCSLPMIPQESIESAFMAVLAALQKNDEPIRNFLKDEEEKWRNAQGAHVALLEIRKEEIQRELRTLEATRNMVDGYQEKRNKLRQELQGVTRSLEFSRDAKLESIKELLQSVRGWDGSSFFAPEDFRGLVKDVKVNGRDSFIFQFQCGFCFSTENAR